MLISVIIKEKGGDVVTVTPSASVPEIAGIIASQRIGAVIVLDTAGLLAGIVSERDIVKAVAGQGDAALKLTAADIMTKNVTTATPKNTVNEAMTLMDAGYFRHLPVVDAGKLVGIISVRDVVRAVIQDQEHEVDSLKSYVFRGEQKGGLR